MTDTLQRSPRPNSTREDALAVVKRLREAGHIAYFAGGCVCDELLGHPPKDYDVATEAPPQRVRQVFSNTSAVGAKFGVILVRIGESQIEVATFRREGPYEDGRRPSEVHFTTAEEDAKRRDFTINGMFFDPIEHRVIDYVGGQEDLKAKVLRAIGDPNLRFEEDHLRLLRGVRFAARFGLTIEAGTADAVGKHAHQLPIISPERIAEELRLMLTPATRVRAWRMLWELQLLPVVFRHVLGKPPDANWDQQPWTIPVPASPPDDSLIIHLPDQSISFGLALATAYVCLQRFVGPLRGAPSDIAEFASDFALKRAVKALRTGLKLSNEELDSLEGTLWGLRLMYVAAWSQGTVALKKRILARKTFADSEALAKAAISAGLDQKGIYAPLLEELRSLQRTDFAPPPLLDGEDLIAVGLNPGPGFKHLLKQLYDEQLEGRLTTKEQALKLAQVWGGQCH